MPNAPFFSPFPHYYPGLRHHYPAYPELFHSRPYSPFPTQQCVWNVCSETFKRISYHISLLQFLWWQLNKIQTSPHCLPQPYGTFHWHLLTSSTTASTPSPSLILNPGKDSLSPLSPPIMIARSILYCCLEEGLSQATREASHPAGRGLQLCPPLTYYSSLRRTPRSRKWVRSRGASGSSYYW